MHHTNTFNKTERLCNKRLIGELYASSKRVMAFPLSVHWMEVETLTSPLQVVIVAPKKKLHHAVARNRAKRLMRECYRLRKGTLTEILTMQGKHWIVSINYIHSELMNYAQLSKAFDKLFERLNEEASK